MQFVHLHNHTHYSLLDGLSRPSDLVERAKAQGSKAIAMTDHGAMSGAVEFYKVAKKADIKPIIGCEIYITEDRFKKNGNGSEAYHLILLAETTEGYHNLMKLVTKANLEGFYYKPRIDHRLLATYSKGLIGSSACLQGEIPQALLSNDHERAQNLLNRYQEIFGKNNFFLELQDHPLIPEQKLANDRLISLAQKTDIPLIATNDSHYPDSNDAEAHDILLCIQTGRTIHDENRMKYNGDFSIRPPEDMIRAFKGREEAIKNTVEIADRCNVEIAFSQDLIPPFIAPQNEPSKEYLEKLCVEGMKKRYGENPSKGAQDRLKYEMSVIHKMGFDNYFLIVQDFIKFAKSKDILVGPGRGSAAGSIIAYVLEITDIDPLKYGLLFERFLNPERISMPDIDIDFADDRRNEVLDYVVNKYGRENVAQIITFGTMAPRAAVRDTGRALGYPYAEVDTIAKVVPPPIQGRHVPLKVSVKEDPDLKKLYDSNERAKTLFLNAMKLEGTVRHAGTHACAVVIAKDPLQCHVPLQKAVGEEDNVITQYSMKPIEEIGLLKMDFLGLKNLAILQKTLELIRDKYDVTIDLRTIPLDDECTFKLMAEGKTTGVFQFESAGMKRYLKDLVPTALADLVAMNALYRPGPMEWIPSYIKGKHNVKTVKYLDPSFELILKETYGVAVYQEQILEIARSFAGFKLGEADILRKAVGKKDPALLQKQREKFIKGAKKQGYSEKFANEVFEKVIEPFASYGFNKAHATCYAMIAYQTAYLKAHYPTAFMAALLTSDQDNMDRVVIEIDECREMGIKVLPPNINESYERFTVSSEDTIRFGLAAIKGLGEATAKEIINIREQKSKFKSIEDFAQKIQYRFLNKKTLEALAYSGALDDLGERKQIAESFFPISSFARNFQESCDQGQTDIFALMDEHETRSIKLSLLKVEPATYLQKLNWEKDYLGLYVSGHPLQGLKKYIRKKAHLIERFSKDDVGKRMTICGLILNIKKVLTRGGEYMAYVTLEDPTGRADTVLFPRTYKAFADFLEKGQVVTMDGKLDSRRDAFQFIVNEIRVVSLEEMLKKAKKEGSYDPNEKSVVVEVEQKLEDKKEHTVKEKEPCVVKVPTGIHADILKAIKDLLLQNKGEDCVEIHINGGEAFKRIKVPFGVKFNPKLQERIENLIQNS